MRISDQGHGWRPPWGAAPNGRREDLRMRASGIAMFVAGALWLAPMAVAAQTQSGTVTPAAPPAAPPPADTAPADTGGQPVLTPAQRQKLHPRGSRMQGSRQDMVNSTRRPAGG